MTTINGRNNAHTFRVTTNSDGMRWIEMDGELVGYLKLTPTQADLFDLVINAGMRALAQETDR